MIEYNIYYKDKKINSNGLSEEEIKQIQSVKFVNKYNKQTKTLEEIPTSQLRIIKCIVFK